MSLIEVLVAVAIFGLAAVGLSAAYGNILLARQTMARLEVDDEAMRLARAAVLAPDALTSKQVRQAGERLSGRVSLSDGTLAEWEAELSPAEIDALFLVKLTVRPEGEARETTQSFHLFRPSWAASADRQARLRSAAEKLRAGRGFEGTAAAVVAPAAARPAVRPAPPRREGDRGGAPARPGDAPAAPPAREGGRPR